MTKRIYPGMLVTVDIVPGLWYVRARAPVPATYYLEPRDSAAQVLSILLPHGTLVRTSKQLRHYTVTDNR